MANKYRLKFYKIDNMKYIGHLDLVKVFQRAIKRSKIPVAYSQGFNPHELTKFAQPLSLGLTSIGEYLDVELISEVSPSTIIENINKCLPIGLKIVEARKLAEGEKGGASLVSAASYKLIFANYNCLDQIANEILDSDSIEVEKQTKSKLTLENIRSDIKKLEVIDGNILNTVLLTGSNRNLKPQLLIKYIIEKYALPISTEEISIEREDLLKDDYTSIYEW